MKPIYLSDPHPHFQPYHMATVSTTLFVRKLFIKCVAMSFSVCICGGDSFLCLSLCRHSKEAVNICFTLRLSPIMLDEVLFVAGFVFRINRKNPLNIHITSGGG